MTDPVFGPRAQIEIANQINIFSRGFTPYSLVNWMPDWCAARSTLEWIGLVYARFNEPRISELHEAFARSN